MTMSERCQYNSCEDSADGALGTPFGVRRYCREHFRLMQDSLHEEPDIVEGLTDDQE